jgi:hypothetical protein
MWVQKKMVPKHELFKSVALHIQALNYEKDLYELKDHVAEEALSSNLPLKLGPIKRIIHAFFFYHLLKNI